MSWWVKRQLARNVAELRQARADLGIADEMSLALPEGEADVEAMDRHRRDLRERIARLEARQDALLDRLPR